jgi:hypothetical protein
MASSGDAAVAAVQVDHGVLKHRQMSAMDKRLVFVAVRSSMVKGVLKKGIFTNLAEQTGFDPKTVSRQWRIMAASLQTLLINHPDEEEQAIIDQNHHILFGTNQFKRRSGKFKHDRELLKAQIRAIALKSRRTRRQLAGQLNLPLTTVHWLVRDRAIASGPKEIYGGTILRVHSSSLKPSLTNANKLHRFLYAVDQLKPGGLSLRVPKFQDHMDRVHVDEKWFWLCQDGEKYILVDDEPNPQRSTRHKNYIEKIMFACAQARPRWDYTKNCFWDGKIGIWAVGHWEVARRSSANRPAGTPVWKSESMDKKKYTEMMLDTIIPAILENWPEGEIADPNFKIRIQQDNAPAHPTADDPFLLGELAKHWDPNEGGCLTPNKITIYCQPPNSPDTNILDLGLFNALQSAYWSHAPKNSGDIIKMVEETYKNYPADKINRIFVTLQSIYDCIILEYGDNHYTIPHLNKEKLEREGRLPRELPVSQDAIENIEDYFGATQPGATPTMVGANGQEIVPLGLDGDSDDATFGSEGERVLEEWHAGQI